MHETTALAHLALSLSSYYTVTRCVSSPDKEVPTLIIIYNIMYTDYQVIRLTLKNYLFLMWFRKIMFLYYIA